MSPGRLTVTGSPTRDGYWVSVRRISAWFPVGMMSPTAARAEFGKQGRASRRFRRQSVRADGKRNWDPGAGDYGMSALKLHPTSQGSLSVKDYFTPMNHAELNEGDTDLGSAGALLVPGTHTLIGGGKEGILYVIDTNHMDT